MTPNCSSWLRLALCPLMAVSLTAPASSILDWNYEARDAISDSGTSGAAASRELAILHTSIYDAVNGITGGYTPYAVSSGAPTGASAEAAAAAAAYTVMSQLYSTRDFSGLYNTQLNSIANGAAKTAGINWGISVATSILTARQNDGSATAGSAGYTITSAPGHWQPTPHSDPGLDFRPNPSLPGWGNVTTFGVTSASSMRPGAPTSLSSTEYANAYNQVYNYGGATGSLRSDDQTHIARFWVDGTSNSTVAGKWNEVASTLAANAGLDLASEARLMAALNVALADAEIVAYNTKYAYDLWRPVTAIAYGNQDGNGSTVGDDFAGTPDGWNPLLDTPTSPEYVDELATLGPAARELLLAYFGDVTINLAADINGDGVINDADATYDKNGDNVVNVLDAFRSFTISEASNEAALALIYGGIGFSFSNTAGEQVGSNVANYVSTNYFQPVAVPEASSLMLLSLGLLIRLRRARRGHAVAHT